MPAHASNPGGAGLRALVVAGFMLLPPHGLHGQSQAESLRVEFRFGAWGSLQRSTGTDAAAERVSLLPGIAFLASAAVPGSGQLVLGEDRGVAYLAIELWSWRTYLDRRAQGRELEARYRDLAWSVARRVSVGARRDTVFEYYEAMTKHPASGAFNRNPNGPELLPETDIRTFNGQIWNLASGLFMPAGGAPVGSPAYERALDYYRRHAVPPGYAWAWGDSELEQQLFAGLIQESDAAFREGGRMLGVLLANHVVSAVDALVAARLRAAGSPVRLRLGTRAEPSDPSRLRWNAGITLVH
jgi:hypothetical protein